MLPCRRRCSASFSSALSLLRRSRAGQSDLAFLVVATGWVVVDLDLVAHVAIELRVFLTVEDVLEATTFGVLLGLESVPIIEDFEQRLLTLQS